MALVVARRPPAAPLATTRRWPTTPLAAELGGADAAEDARSAPLAWRLARQGRIKQRLAAWHLGAGAPVFAAGRGSASDGRPCPLLRCGSRRAGKRGKPQVGSVGWSAPGGCPVAAYPGTPPDSAPVPGARRKLREGFGLAGGGLVGTRERRLPARSEARQRQPGRGRVSARRVGQGRARGTQEALHRSLGDEGTLAALAAPAYPGERLAACRPPLLAAERPRPRAARLLRHRRTGRARGAQEAARRTRTPLGAGELGRTGGRVLEKHKRAKPVAWAGVDDQWPYRRPVDTIVAAARRDGISGLRPRAPGARLAVAATVRTDKGLADGERGFRALKGLASRGRAPLSRGAAGARALAHLPAGGLPGVAPAARPGAAAVRRRDAGGGAHGSPGRRPHRHPGPSGSSPGAAPPPTCCCTAWARCSPPWPRAAATPAGGRPLLTRRRSPWSRRPPSPSAALRIWSKRSQSRQPPELENPQTGQRVARFLPRELRTRACSP